eukprot:5941252-Amphidinium_carterae.1
MLLAITSQFVSRLERVSRGKNLSGATAGGGASVAAEHFQYRLGALGPMWFASEAKMNQYEEDIKRKCASLVSM